MKPQKQLFRHRPADGVYGDCHRTAIAIVLDMDAKDVPHFAQGAPDAPENKQWMSLREAWLNERGFMSINLLFSGDVPFPEVLKTIAACNPKSRPVFILGGKSKNGNNHSVVCTDGKIVCDPGQGDPGIVGPCHDGFYWVTFFAGLLTTKIAAKRKEPA